jgi:TetR/AcrR family transcriptional regulator
MADHLSSAPARRMPAHQRQQEILEAAVVAFAESGYFAATTDQIARIAGVSQPYVVRMFRSKQALFIAAHTYVVDRIEAAFRSAVDNRDESVSPMNALERAYLDLIPDRNLLRMIQHSFTMGADPQFGPPVRDCLVRIYQLVRELTGATPKEVNAFVAHGLLINTLVTVQMQELADIDPDTAECFKAAMGDAVPGTVRT